MSTGFLRSVIIVTFCSLVIGILEFFHQGMPPLVDGYLPAILYLLQLLSFYTAVGAGIGLASALGLYAIHRLFDSELLMRILRDLVPVLIMLLIYFNLGGGYSPKITAGLEPPQAGCIAENTVFTLVIVISLIIPVAGFFVKEAIIFGIGTMRDFARGFSVLVLFVSTWVGLSYAVKFPVGGKYDEDIGQAEGKDRPVLVFGIDGASWEVAMPLVKAGAMPNLKALMERGVYGNFRTVGTALSSAIWTDLATGKERSKHGITGNIMVSEGSYQAFPPRSYHRKVPAIWNILSHEGKKVAIANWRVTYPPEKVNGVMASMLVFDKPGKVYPPSLEAELIKISKPKRRWKAPALREAAAEIKGPEQVAREFLYDMTIERSVFNYLADHDDFDLYAFYSHTTDAAQHLFWLYREPDLFKNPPWNSINPSWMPDERNVSTLHGFIDEVYVRADSMLGEVLERIQGDPRVVVISDHGQQPSKVPILLVDINRLLSLLGFLRFDSDQHPDFATATLYPLVPITMTNVGALALNIKGRESQGWIEQGDEADEAMNEVITKLREIRVVETGEQFFKTVRRIKDSDRAVYRLEDRVDILVRCNSDAYNGHHHLEIDGSEYPMTDFIEMREVSGRHTNIGIFIISSPEFKRGILLPASNTMTAKVLRYRARKVEHRFGWPSLKVCEIFNLYEEASTLDLTPTLLYMFDLPQGRDMDGKPLLTMVKDEVIRVHGLTYIESYDDILTRPEHLEEAGGSDDELERLRALGYIR